MKCTAVGGMMAQLGRVKMMVMMMMMILMHAFDIDDDAQMTI